MEFIVYRFFLLMSLLFFGAWNVSGQSVFLDESMASGFSANGVNRGIAIDDFDRDGDDDMYISRINQANLLYRNNGDGTFTDVAMQAGVDHELNSHVSVWGDFDNDGYPDLYVGNRDTPNLLYHNNGDGTFTDIAVAAGVDILGKPRAALVADVDQDGFLDLYVANLNSENALFRNNGDGTFTDITASSGTSDPLLSMGAMFFDYDNDGDQDLYLTHDGNQAYKLLQNDGTGKYVDVSQVSGTDYEGLGMGVDFGDINNDGWLDIYITNLSYNTLYLNNGDGTFSDISESAAVIDPGMGWGITFLDFDNDSWQDIYMVNDSYFSPLPNILYRNQGDLSFEPFATDSPVASMYGSYGVACFDYNFDGLLDIFMTNSGTDGNQLLKNNYAEAGNWLQVKLEGTTSNRSAIGTRLSLKVGGQILVDEVCGGSSYASQNSRTLHFGLGSYESIEELIIRWPNGAEQTYLNVAVNQFLSVVENGEITVSTHSIPKQTPNFKLYPNPLPKDMPLQVSIQQEPGAHYEIRLGDLTGKINRKLFSGTVSEATTLMEFDIADLPRGCYWISISSKQYVNSQKLILH